MAKKKSRQMADDIMAGVAEIQAMIRNVVKPQERFSIRSAGQDTPRAGWEEQIKKALSEHGDDVDADWLSAPLASKSDEKECRWWA